jgi:hypothetical protein
VAHQYHKVSLMCLVNKIAVLCNRPLLVDLLLRKHIPQLDLSRTGICSHHFQQVKLFNRIPSSQYRLPLEDRLHLYLLLSDLLSRVSLLYQMQIFLVDLVFKVLRRYHTLHQVDQHSKIQFICCLKPFLEETLQDNRCLTMEVFQIQANFQ